MESWEPGLENGMRHHDSICAGSCQSNYIPGPKEEVGLPVLIREFYTGDSLGTELLYLALSRFRLRCDADSLSRNSRLRDNAINMVCGILGVTL